MKKLLLLLIFTTTLTLAQEGAESKKEFNYEKEYASKIDVIKQTQFIINNVVKELKEKKFSTNAEAKKMIGEAMEILEEAEKFKQEYLLYAQDEKWKQAFYLAESYWQKQVMAADLLFRAKKLLEKE